MLSILIIISSQLSFIYCDVNTFSNYNDVHLNDIHLEWLLNLDVKVINCTAVYQFQIIHPTNEIHLDVYQIDIRFIYTIDGKVLKHEITTIEDQSLIQGDRLVITLPRQFTSRESLTIKIKYDIDERAKALGFLTKEQTYSKQYPYLFSLCQDNKCRSMIPLQDTPSVKFTLSATLLTLDANIKAYMTGKQIENIPHLNQYTQPIWAHYFSLDIPIPSYLIGIVAGELGQQQIAGNVYLISEPHFLDKYPEELSEIPEYLEILEQYIGEYIWGDYKIVVLPASCPFGGMEHPLLTFASPTIIVGDKSGISTAVHEMAHSWMGNMVTGKDWSNLWINEGFCVFLERKALSTKLGVDFIELEGIIGNQNLLDAINQFQQEPSYQTLHPNTLNRNPDDSMSIVPYEKGYQLLKYLESLIGELQFKLILRQYIAQFKFTSIDEDQFYQFLLLTVDPKHQAQIKTIYKSWVYDIGLPPVEITFNSVYYTDATELAQQWIIANKQPDQYEIYYQFIPTQKEVFLQYLQTHLEQVTLELVETLDNTYKISDSSPLVALQWFKVALVKNHVGCLDGVHKFVSTIGVKGYLVQIYKLLIIHYNDLAHLWFEENRYFYHHSVVKKIEQLFTSILIEQVL